MQVLVPGGSKDIPVGAVVAVIVEDEAAVPAFSSYTGGEPRRAACSARRPGRRLLLPRHPPCRGSSHTCLPRWTSRSQRGRLQLQLRGLSHLQGAAALAEPARNTLTRTPALADAADAPSKPKAAAPTAAQPKAAAAAAAAPAASPFPPHQVPGCAHAASCGARPPPNACARPTWRPCVPARPGDRRLVCRPATLAPRPAGLR
jgi:pyruvate dehydrogenase E2 component (dihydrolipoamide acetyltransferase)